MREAGARQNMKRSGVLLCVDLERKVGVLPGCASTALLLGGKQHRLAEFDATFPTLT